MALLCPSCKSTRATRSYLSSFLKVSQSWMFHLGNIDHDPSQGCSVSSSCFCKTNFKRKHVWRCLLDSVTCCKWCWFDDLIWVRFLNFCTAMVAPWWSRDSRHPLGKMFGSCTRRRNTLNKWKCKLYLHTWQLSSIKGERSTLFSSSVQNDKTMITVLDKMPF